MNVITYSFTFVVHIKLIIMRKIPFLIISILCLFSCEKDIQTNSNAMQAKINNDFWKATSISASKTAAGGLTIKGSSGLGILTLNINSTDVGVYTLGTANESIFATYEALKNDPNTQLYQTLISTGLYDISIDNQGTGYITEGVYSTTASGKGYGLTVRIKVDGSGAITEAIIQESGYDYEVGEIITIVSGDGNATLIVENIVTDDYGGEIEITNYDGATVTGTFKFNAINEVDQTITFKEGLFYKVPVN